MVKCDLYLVRRDSCEREEQAKQSLKCKEEQVNQLTKVRQCERQSYYTNGEVILFYLKWYIKVNSHLT